ncbi:Gfo/Idh/MocA family protein [Paenibacillus flagellatus]|uniref:Gfo/Idh/MocA family oxidoreductase n=1 Tax=Paenibacillus flagellatus TaxID=2211139 RepID=A0A2V5KAR9_9BACL|nr:Gfo/Idh/MocA family oxidoreductase [Paenibacillus flagellatus]PYI55214.1 gfo/Idh/MocA family oxidoreductase [Paenibacillus flagellatus]
MTVKIGMIGAGGIARHHLNTLSKIPLAQVVGVFDVNRESAERAAASVGARVADSADALLNRSDIDAVFICTPQFARDDLEAVAAGRGIHLFVEKPLGLELDSVRRKEKAIREAGVLHSVGYVLRYYDTVQQAKHYLQGRTVHLVQAYRFGTSHPAAWWRQQHQSGGHLADAVTHQVDLIRYLVGEYRDVSARFGRSAIGELYPDATIADAGAVSFTLESGAVGTITESCISPFNGESEIKLFGPDFYVQLSGNGKTVTIIDKERHVTITSKRDPSYEQDKAFVEAVASGSGDSILCGYADGMRTLAFALAAHRSAESGGAVPVEDEGPPVMA